MQLKYNRKKLVFVSVIIASFAFLFSPLPGTEALLLDLTNNPDTALGLANIHTLELTLFNDVNDNVNCSGDCQVTFTSPETIPADSILQLILDEDSTQQQTCSFTIAGAYLEDQSTNCAAVSAVELDKIIKVGSPYE